MPSKPTKLRALLIGVPSIGLASHLAVDMVSQRLEAMFDDVDVHTIVGDVACTRDKLLESIQAWVDGAAEGEPHLFYYFGHGDRVRFIDQPDVEDLIFYYLACTPNEGRSEGVLDFELSGQLTRLHQICGNVTSIVDCCHSSLLVAKLQQNGGQLRNGVQVVHESPQWAIDALSKGPAAVLAAESHPEVVRLAGASPVREAAAEVISGAVGAVGSFTLKLVEELAFLDQDWFRTSWSMVAHAVRQRVIEGDHSEHQWITLAGPSDRLLFSRDETHSPSRLVGCVEHGGNHWIRAGELTGVEEHDVWSLAARFVDDHDEHHSIVEGTATDIESNRTRLLLTATLGEESKPVAAFLKRVSNPMPVYVEPETDIPLEMDKDTVWLAARGIESDQHVRVTDGELQLVDGTDAWAMVRFDASRNGWAAMIELLEDRARARRLVTSLRELSVDLPSPPIEWTVGVEDTIKQSGAHLKSGDALWIHLQNTSESAPVPTTWFTAVVLIDIVGRPWLLSSSQLDGIELGPKDEEFVGQRFGAAQKGLKLEWPEGVGTITEGKVQLVFAMSRRPIQLAHLTHAFKGSDPAALRMQGLDALEVDDGEGQPDPLAHAVIPPSGTLTASEAWGFGSLKLILERGAE